MPIKLGTAVRQKVKIIEGVVVERKFHETHDQMEYLVESPDDDGDGTPQTRWMLERDLEEIPGEVK